MSECMDFSTQTCRACLDDKGITRPLFGTSLKTKLTELASIKMEPDDGLPDHICENCVVQINQAYRFIKRCKQSERKLRTIYQNAFNSNDFDIIQSDVNDSFSPPNHKAEFYPESTTTKKYCLTIMPHFNVSDNETGEMANVNLAMNKDLTSCDEESLDQNVDLDIMSLWPKEDNTALVNGSSADLNSNDGDVETVGFNVNVFNDYFDNSSEPSSTSGYQNNQPKTLECGTCNRSFLTKHSYLRHLSTHSIDRPYQCKVCGKAFSQNYCLTRHEKTHTDEKPHQCETCFKSFSQSYYLRRHIMTHSSERSFQCNFCQKTFVHRYSLRKHMRIHNTEMVS